MAMGRPPKNESEKKKHFFKIRLNESDEEKLQKCAEHYGLSKTDVFRSGLDIMFDDIEKK